MKRITLILLIFFTYLSYGQTGENCAQAIDLGLSTSPLTGTTVGALNDNLSHCGFDGDPVENTAPDLFYSILVPAGSTLKIGQTDNDYDSSNVAFYGTCANRIQVACYDDADDKLVTWANNTGVDQTFYWIQDGYSSNEGNFTLAWELISCSAAVANFEVVSLCGTTGSEQFNIEVNITNLGSSSTVTVSDDQDSSPQIALSTGVLTFGPYENGTEVVITLINDDNEDCFLESQTLGQNACPPANDNPSGATLLTFDLGNECGANTLTNISNEASTGSNLPNPSCGGYNPSADNGDIWFKFVAPSSEFKLNAMDYEGDIYSLSGVLYSGAIGSFTEVDGCGSSWPKTYTELTEGATYYLRVWSTYNYDIGTFSLCGTYLNCVNPTVNYSVVSDCANGEQFLVAVNLTNLGSATTLTIDDDFGSSTVIATATGTYTFGPYPNDTPVIFTIANEQDLACTISSNELNQIACPPANDTCATAIDLATQTSPLTGTTLAATNTNLFICNNSNEPLANSHGDVYYKVEVPNGSTLNIGLVESDFDSAVVVFYGDCASRTQIVCFDDPNTRQIEWSNDTGSSKTVYWIQDAYSGYGEFTLQWSVIACTMSEVAFAKVGICSGTTSGFNVTANITNMGSATSITVTDNRSSAPQTITAPGLVTFGPYANGTTVILKAANDQDISCTITSNSFTQNVCPPNNDDCAAAINLIPGNALGVNAVDTSVEGASGSDVPNPFCSYAGADIWYSVVIPSDGNITIQTGPSSTNNSSFDSAMAVYSGTCASLVQIGVCDDDGVGGGSRYSKIQLTNRTPGETIYVRVWAYNNATTNPFSIGAWSATLSNETFDMASFKAYPNPVKDILKLSYKDEISNVAIFNLIGQQLLSKDINATNAEIDMSALSKGTYLIKVNADDKVKTFKVLKQ